MRLQLRLVGHEADWVFEETSAMDTWLAAKPWSGGAAQRVGVLRVESGLVTSAFRAAPLQFQMRSALEAKPIRTLSWRVLRNGGLRGLSGALGLPENPPLIRVVDAIQQQHGAVPTVVIAAMDAAAGTAADAGVTLETLQSLADLCFRRGVRFSALLVQSAEASDSWDCRVGCPDGSALGVLGDFEDTLWRRYLHIRLAWHSGGQWTRCTASADAWEEIAVGDDDAVERLLNDEADRWASEVGSKSPTVLKELFLFLAGDPGPEAALSECGMLWRPAGKQRRQPTPWVARALLASKDRSPFRSNLRASVVCEPLVRALLERVFEAEWRLRDLLTLSPHFTSAQEEVGTPPPHSSSRFLPRSDGRLLPQHPWDYLALGELLAGVATMDPKLKRYRPLVDLRNALAHGHPVGWQGVLDVKQAWVNMENAAQTAVKFATRAAAG